MTAFRATITYEISYEIDTDHHEYYFGGDEAWLATATDQEIADNMVEVDVRNDVIDLITVAKDVDYVEHRAVRIK